MYETSEDISMDTKALIFREGQQDQFGRVFPLAIFGRTHDGRCITAQRNVFPSLFAVRSALQCAEAYKMTHLTVGIDACG